VGGFRSWAELAGAARARFDPQVELALLRVYGIDVLDPNISLRRVALAVTALPMGSWPDPDHDASWSVTDHLLATLCDCVRENTWVTAQANAGKRKIDRPKPVDRPGRRHQPAPNTKTIKWSDFVKDLPDG
jgi:hypothetical protein